MDHAPRRPSRCDRKYVYFNPDVKVRIVKPLHRRAKRSELWVSSEDLKRTRQEFHGILDCLTLDSSFYEGAGYFLLGLDSKQDQKHKYRNMQDSRYAVLKEQRQQNANSRWHCGVGTSNMEECISKSYQELTAEAANTARHTAMRLEEELNAQEVVKSADPQAHIMSLDEVKSLLMRANSSSRNSIPPSASSNEVNDVCVNDGQSLDESSSDDWSVDYSTDDDDDLYGEEEESIEVPIAEPCAPVSKCLEQHEMEVTRSTAPSSDWSVDISTDNDDEFLELESRKVLESSSSIAKSIGSRGSLGSLSKQSKSPQGSEIFVPTIILPAHQPKRNNAIAAWLSRGGSRRYDDLHQC